MAAPAFRMPEISTACLDPTPLATSSRLPGIPGRLWIDPTLPILVSSSLSDAQGRSETELLLPGDLGLVGIPFVVQGAPFVTNGFRIAETAVHIELR